MRPERNPELCAGNLGFLARQTAGQSHELTNVLNVINELTGLMSDMLSGLAEGRAVDPERLMALPGRIADQVRRGEALVRLVNQFVHTADAEWALVDLSEALERAAALAARRARLCRSTLETALPADPLALETSPLGLQHAVVFALELALEPLGHEPAQGGTLVLGCAGAPAHVEVTIARRSGAPLGPLSPRGLEALDAILESLGATLDERLATEASGPGGPVSRSSLPRAVPAPDPDLTPAALVLRFPRRLVLAPDAGPTPGRDPAPGADPAPTLDTSPARAE